MSCSGWEGGWRKRAPALAAPRVLPQEKSAADVSHIVGALVVTVSVISMWEPIVAAIISGVAVAQLSLPRGTIREPCGFRDRFVR